MTDLTNIREVLPEIEISLFEFEYVSEDKQRREWFSLTLNDNTKTWELRGTLSLDESAKRFFDQVAKDTNWLWERYKERQTTDTVMSITKTLLGQKHSRCDCGIADEVFEALEEACK